MLQASEEASGDSSEGEGEDGEEGDRDVEDLEAESGSEDPGETVYPSSDVPVLPVADVIARARFDELFQSFSMVGLTRGIEDLSYLGEEEGPKEGEGGAEGGAEDGELDLEGIDEEEIDKVCASSIWLSVDNYVFSVAWTHWSVWCMEGGRVMCVCVCVCVCVCA